MQPDQIPVESLDADTTERDIEQDGVAALRDVEAEQGDEQGLHDMSIADKKALKSVGALLDDRGGEEPDLD